MQRKVPLVLCHDDDDGGDDVHGVLAATIRQTVAVVAVVVNDTLHVVS